MSGRHRSLPGYSPPVPSEGSRSLSSRRIHNLLSEDLSGESLYQRKYTAPVFSFKTILPLPEFPGSTANIVPVVLRAITIVKIMAIFFLNTLFILRFLPYVISISYGQNRTMNSLLSYNKRNLLSIRYAVNTTFSAQKSHGISYLLP